MALYNLDATSGGSVAEPVYNGSPANGWTNFWDAFTHPISMFSGLVKANMSGVADEYNTKEWSSVDWLNYARNGTLPYTKDSMIQVNGSPIVGSSNADASEDPSGYDQAQWELDRQRELLAEQREYNSAEAQKNRDWQERMSNTAYQRAVEDLQQAGLNKWLAVTGGGNGASASTPSGSSASSQSGDASAPNPYLAKAMLQFGQSILSSILKFLK